VTVFLTAFYMFRAVFLTPLRRARGGWPPARPAGRDDGPLWILALLSIVGAALGGAALGLTFPEFLRGTTGGRSRTFRPGSRRSPSGSRSRA
jgi:hypothetical protein